MIKNNVYGAIKILKLCEQNPPKYFFSVSTDKATNPVKISKLQTEVWGHNSKLETHTVETHIYRLRKKINTQFGDKNFILNDKKGYSVWKKEINSHLIYFQKNIVNALWSRKKEREVLKEEKNN